MEDVKEITLPSGAILRIGLPSIERADALFEAVMEESKGVGAENKVDALKNMACTFYSSAKVKKALAECLKTCTYNGAKISSDTFEPRAAREDKPVVMFEVAQETLAPFMKSLFAMLSPLLEKQGSFPA